MTSEEIAENFFKIFKKITLPHEFFAVSPIWRADLTENNNYETFTDIGDIIAEEDSKIKNTVYINGTGFIPHGSEYFGDGFLHPNDAGFEFYNQKLYELIVSVFRYN